MLKPRELEAIPLQVRNELNLIHPMVCPSQSIHLWHNKSTVD